MLIFFKQTNNIEVFNFDKIVYMCTLKVDDNWRFCIYTNGDDTSKYIYYTIKTKSDGNRMIQQILNAAKAKQKFVELEF